MSSSFVFITLCGVQRFRRRTTHYKTTQYHEVLNERKPSSDWCRHIWKPLVGSHHFWMTPASDVPPCLPKWREIRPYSTWSTYKTYLDMKFKACQNMPCFRMAKMYSSLEPQTGLKILRQKTVHTPLATSLALSDYMSFFIKHTSTAIFVAAAHAKLNCDSYTSGRWSTRRYCQSTSWTDDCKNA